MRRRRFEITFRCRHSRRNDDLMPTVHLVLHLADTTGLYGLMGPVRELSAPWLFIPGARTKMGQLPTTSLKPP